MIAEIGMNHYGQLGLARNSVEAAGAAGCDAVKFQNFRTEDFIQDKSLTYTYESQGKTVTEPFFDLCKRNEFQKEWIPELCNLSEEFGMEFLSTPSSEKGISDLAEAGCKFVKNGADALTHLPLLRAMAESGMHVIVSTGMAYEDDIDSALNALAPALPNRLTLLHCTSNYPTKPEDTNLRRMLSLKDKYGLPVGFSDHTCGWQAAVQAVTLGAVSIEKHFTLDHNLPGPDHWFSSNPAEMKELVSQVRQAEICMGLPDIQPATGELPVRDEFRLGLIAARNLKAGEELDEEMVVFRKPAKGLLPRDLPIYLGRVLKSDINKDDPIFEKNF